MCYIIKALSEIATVAQSVEQLIRNQQVAGSNPASSSKNTDSFLTIRVFLYFMYFLGFEPERAER